MNPGASDEYNIVITARPRGTGADRSVELVVLCVCGGDDELPQSSCP